MVHAGGMSTSRRRGVMGVRVLAAAGGTLALVCLPACARAQAEEEGDIAVEGDEEGGEPDKNSSVAKAVEVRYICSLDYLHSEKKTRDGCGWRFAVCRGQKSTTGPASK